MLALYKILRWFHVLVSSRERRQASLERFEALGAEGPVVVRVWEIAGGLRLCLASDQSVNGHDGDGENGNDAQQHTDGEHPV